MNKEDINWDRVGKFMGGGLMLGGSAAAGMALIKLLNRLYDKRDADSSTSYDDDVLYLNLDKQASEKEANSTEALTSYLGALLAGYVGYKGVSSIFNKVRENQLQKELDQAQSLYMSRLGGEGFGKEAQDKKAYSNMDNLGAAAIGVPLLIALLSGVMTNKILSKAKPGLSKGQRPQKVRKLVVKSRNPDRPETSVDDVADMDPNGEDIENLMRTVMSKESSSIESGFADLVTKVANGGFDEFKDNFKKYGFNTAMDMVKGARFKKASELNKSLAVSLLCHDKAIQKPLEVAVAAEFHNMGSGICKLASQLDETFASILTYAGRPVYKKLAYNIYKPFTDKLVEVKGQDSFDVDMLKSAIDITDIGLLKTLLEKEPEEEVEEPQENASTLQVSKSVDSDSPEVELNSDTKEPLMEADSEDSRNFIEENEDLIDSLLQTGMQ